jgi:hypothetical protein
MNPNIAIQIAELATQYNNYDKAIKAYGKIAEHLSSDKCNFSMHIVCHNLDQHKINEASQQQMGVELPPWYVQLPGMPKPECRNDKLPPCRQEILDVFTETEALRIVSAIIKEKVAARAAILKQISDLAGPDRNPIFDLHK